MGPYRRHLLHQLFKLVDLLIMVGSFGAAAWVFASQTSDLGFREFLALRLTVSNLLLFLLLVAAWHALFTTMGLLMNPWTEFPPVIHKLR